MRLHGIFAGELQAMEAAGARCSTFPTRRGEFQLDMARQVWTRRGTAKSSCACCNTWVPSRATIRNRDPVALYASRRSAARVAGINRGLEGLACDVFDQLIRVAQKNGDQIIERAVDYVLADEITHVRMGSKWMRKLTGGRPRAVAARAGVPGQRRRPVQPRAARARRSTTWRRIRRPSRSRASAPAGRLHRRKSTA